MSLKVVNTNPLYDSSVKAICFLKKNKDSKNCIYFTDEVMIITLKGRSHVTPLTQVRNISVGTRKLLGPIIIGGVMFPLSGLALLTSISSPLTLILLMIAGLFLLLYGFGGSPAITIETSGGTQHYFIQKTGQNIENFVNYFNHEIKERI